jgi:hypothetical protein
LIPPSKVEYFAVLNHRLDGCRAQSGLVTSMKLEVRDQVFSLLSFVMRTIMSTLEGIEIECVAFRTPDIDEFKAQLEVYRAR